MQLRGNNQADLHKIIALISKLLAYVFRKKKHTYFFIYLITFATISIPKLVLIFK